jgi:DnaJ-class molecular chaperone
MKKIDDYRKLLGVTKTATLKELKSVYRGMMKDFHPDKIQDNEIAKLEAEEKSKSVIEAYHFIVSISPETWATYKEEYTQTISNSLIADLEYKNQTLRIDYADGNSFEYFDVPKNIFTKFINADSQNRFARRQICNAYVYRKVSTNLVPVEN